MRTKKLYIGWKTIFTIDPKLMSPGKIRKFIKNFNRKINKVKNGH